MNMFFLNFFPADGEDNGAEDPVQHHGDPDADGPHAHAPTDDLRETDPDTTYMNCILTPLGKICIITKATNKLFSHVSCLPIIMFFGD